MPGADDKMVCKYDENKIMILEAINAHLCTSFSFDSSYVVILITDNPHQLLLHRFSFISLVLFSNLIGYIQGRGH